MARQKSAAPVQAWNHGFRQRQFRHCLREVAGQRIADPHADVVADDVVLRMAQGQHGAVQGGGNGARVVAAGRAFRVAAAGRIDGDGLVALGRQRRHHMAPRVPGLRPAGDQQHGFAFAGDDAMQALAVDAHVVVGVAVVILMHGKSLY